MTTLFLISNIFILWWVLIYIRNVIKKNVSMNLSTWIIWIFLGIIDVISYTQIVEENIKGLMALISLIWMITIIILANRKGKFKKIDLLDKCLLALGVLTIIAWIISESYIITNLLLQIWFVIGYVPTILGIYKGEIKEYIRPRIMPIIWLIISIIWLSIYYDWRFTLVYPIARILSNLWIVIAVLTTKHKKQ
jgi:hypothetical protein